MKLDKAQEEIIKKKVGGQFKEIIVKPTPIRYPITTDALGEESPLPVEYK